MGRRPVEIKKTTTPDVILDLVWRDGLFLFELRNIAATPVTKVGISFRRPVMGQAGRLDIAKLPIWSRLAFMPPGKVIEVHIDRAEIYFQHNPKTALGVAITYRDAQGQRFNASVSHDFHAYQGMPDVRIRDVQVPQGGRG